jgi:hypothetical protein
MSNSKRDRVSLNEIVGRDALAQQVWQMLEENSLVFTGDRRMGKTCLLNKLQDEAELQQRYGVQGWLCLYQDLSGCSSPLEFVQRVFDTAQDLLSMREKMAEKTRVFLSRFQESRIGLIQLPKSVIPKWKKILRSIFADLSEQLPNDRVVFLWDEFPVMLDEIIKQQGGEIISGEILNLLHELRATYPRVRMILTGSVGLHHILNKLRQSGFNNPANNDMAVLSITPLEPYWGVSLARSKLVSYNIQCQDLDAVAETIAKEANNIPFYITVVVKRLRYHPQDPPLLCDVEMIKREVLFLLVDADNELQMDHYLDRIENYYGNVDSELVRQILDVVAESTQPITTRDIINIINNASSPPINNQLIRDLLRLLEQDHYLAKDPIDLTYTFRNSLIRRCWQCQRG